MTVDVHKYGLAAKGASCVLYRSVDLRKHQYTAVANWSGSSDCARFQIAAAYRRATVVVVTALCFVLFVLFVVWLRCCALDPGQVACTARPRCRGAVLVP